VGTELLEAMRRPGTLIVNLTDAATEPLRPFESRRRQAETGRQRHAGSAAAALSAAVADPWVSQRNVYPVSTEEELDPRCSFLAAIAHEVRRFRGGTLGQHLREANRLLEEAFENVERAELRAAPSRVYAGRVIRD